MVFLALLGLTRHLLCMCDLSCGLPYLDMCVCLSLLALNSHEIQVSVGASGHEIKRALVHGLRLINVELLPPTVVAC